MAAVDGFQEAAAHGRQFVSAGVQVGFWLFCELCDDFRWDVSEGDLCAGDPLFLDPFSVLLAVEEHGVRGVDAVRVAGEGGYHLHAMLVVALPNATSTGFSMIFPSC